MKITKKILALLLALLLVIACFAGCQAKKTNNKDDASSVQTAEISITVDIVKDGETKNLIIRTDEKYLANALAEAGVIEYREDGFYTTVDGVTADYNKDGAWWCVTKSGEMTMVGMNELELSNGDKYEITYTK
ncbi:MAG: DUF4430 domain-containing protein [Clostridia bacterium]|nr:DUF4430 domain-containing protein [Clostridia bacterium]